MNKPKKDKLLIIIILLLLALLANRQGYNFAAIVDSIVRFADVVDTTIENNTIKDEYPINNTEVINNEP